MLEFEPIKPDCSGFTVFDKKTKFKSRLIAMESLSS